MVQIDFGRKLDNKYRFDSRHLVTGYFHATRKGVGFVQPDQDTGGDDMYIAPQDTMGALDGDKVSVKIVQNGFNIRNVVVEVLEHHYTGAIGVVREEKNKFYVVPNNTRLPEIRISRKQIGNAKPDDMVAVRFLTYGDGTTGPTGSVTEILGNKDEKGVDLTAIVRELEIPTAFSREEEEQAGELSALTSTGGTTSPSRLDLRDHFMITIDETGTRDIDDAVSLEKKDHGWELGVHIADAAYYIQKGTPLDLEAYQRGTSVYLPDRIIHMLPEEISTGLCSLNAGEDKLAISVLMTINENGQITDHKITPSVIRVAYNLDYETAQKIMDDDIDASAEDLSPASASGDADSSKVESLPPQSVSGILRRTLQDMALLGSKLQEMRHGRGEVGFELPDVQIILDASGFPKEIRAREENAASRMISDFMIAANETVAYAFASHKLPCIYRVHKGPDAASQEAIRKLAVTLHVNPGDDNKDQESAGISSMQLQRILDQTRGTQWENLVTFVVLRSMTHADYEAQCGGHYGLAAPYYCHFTSPIRRYPDLVVHRLIHAFLDGSLVPEQYDTYHNELTEVAAHCSAMEHRSNVCEREAVRWKILQYLAVHTGEESDGVISGVNKWGFFVQLPNTAEGHVDIRSLDDDTYDYEDDTYSLKGTKSGKIYRLGDTVHIRIESVDLEEKSTDFILC